jgi:membrane protein required for colicin V production
MYWLDFVLLVILGIGALLGARSGLLWQVARVVTFALAIFTCVKYHHVAADWLTRNITGISPLVSGLLAYGVTFLAVYLVCFLVFHMLEKALRAANLKPMDRLLGAVAGVLKASLLAGAVLMGVALYATPESDDTLAQSKIAPVLLKEMRVVIVAVPQKYKDDLSHTLDRLKKDAANKVKEETDKNSPEKQSPKKPDSLHDPLD